MRSNQYSEKTVQVEFISELDKQFKRYKFDCLLGETVYEAATRAAIKLPISCRNGVCHICRAKLYSGKVLSGAYRSPIDAQRIEAHPSDESLKKTIEDGQEVMLCQTWPETSCEIAVKNVYGPGELPLKNVKCQVLSVEVIKGYVYQVELQLPAGKTPEFYAGQYLSLNVPGKEGASFFSIASRPGIRVITLHIQADPHLESALDVINFLQNCQAEKLCVAISLPFGEACLSLTPTQGLILMAAGTGFAQMKSIIEHLFSLNFAEPISLYWGVRKQDDMYMQPLAIEWEKRHANFKFKALIADDENIDANVHHNQLSDAVLADHQDLSDCLVFVSGSPKLVFSAMDALVEVGLPEQRFFSDVLAYATRD
jgi:CDP-4-dehydro-6-deoxyglucose reductase